MSTNSTSDLNSAHYQAYHYNPSLVAAIIFIVVFGLTTVVHFAQLVRTRTWYFIPLVIGGLFETVGYVGRALSAHETPNWTLAPFILQSLLLLLAPVLFAASVYMVLSRIVCLVGGEHLSPVRRALITKLFVLADFFAFMTQSTGGSILANGDPEKKASGRYIILGGLFLQIIFFGCFICLAAIFHRRLNKSPTDQSSASEIPWKKHMIVLYLASVLIMVRSIFRAVEYIQGDDGYLLQHEYWLYIFDATLMALVMIVYNIAHPYEVKKLYYGVGSEAAVSTPSYDIQLLGNQEAKFGRGAQLQG